MQMRMKIVPLIIALTLVVNACKKSDNVEKEVLGAEEKVNVSYGSSNSNKADIYLPDNRDVNTKVLVLLHGGFWAQGDKEEMTPYAKYFQSKGYAVVNMNYRLADGQGNNIHPTQVNDIKQVIELIASKASEWNIAPDKIGIIGASSGGHLALLYTYAYDTKNIVKTVISIAGPTNFTDNNSASNFQKLIVARFLGGTFEANFSAYVQASPITHVSGSSKSTLLVQGKQDVIVPYQQALDLKAKLDQFQVANKLLLYDNAGHEDVINTENIAAVLNEIVNWLNIYVK
jgi:dipeptidyl aminopeptidase/acylaminoacyl peptidase